MATVWVLGSGGREHALAWKLAQSSEVHKVYCTPGNAGSALVAENLDIDLDDHQAVIDRAKALSVDLVMIGPEALLVAGLSDALLGAGVTVFGPSSQAAKLEASKAFTKHICAKAEIPTAQWQECQTAEQARDVLRSWGAPIVIKADGLAAGKGVVVAESVAEAEGAIAMMMEQQAFGDAADCVVIEECLFGLEASLFVLCDGNTAVPLGLARDHKRIGDNDTGANTGGMGCFTPIGDDQAIIDEAMRTIVAPSLRQMAEDGTPFCGVLFAGLMLTDQGVKLIEYNVRFGDPECQALMCRLKDDLYPLLLAAAEGRLDEMLSPQWDSRHVVNVVLSAPGYPASYAKDLALPETFESEQVVMFHAGTARNQAGELVSAGGRVINVCAFGDTLVAARTHAYRAIADYGWDQGYYRKDIALVK